MLGAILFLIVTIPLARLVDWLIAREQRKVGARRRAAATSDIVPADPALAGGGGVTV